MSDKKSRNWCFTLNNPTEEERSILLPNLPPGAKFVKFQLEKGDSGTPHYQGLIIMKNACRLSSMKSLLTRAHWEPMKSLKGSLAYVEKMDSRIDGPWQAGDPPKQQGTRTDLGDLCQSITDGTVTAEQVAIDNPVTYHQYGRTLHKVEDIVLRNRFRTEMTKGIWIWGPTGSGKSHEAFEGYDPTTHYLWKNDKGWQDGYTGQETVIINDFRGHIPYDEMLQMVDKWPYTIPRRGREPAPFLAKKVIVTSSLPPQEVYCRRAMGDSIEQLLRRFTIKHKSGQGE